MKFKRVFLWISGWVAAQEELDLFSRMVPLEAWESQDRHLILIFFVKTKISFCVLNWRRLDTTATPYSCFTVLGLVKPPYK